MPLKIKEIFLQKLLCSLLLSLNTAKLQMAAIFNRAGKKLQRWLRKELKNIPHIKIIFPLPSHQKLEQLCEFSPYKKEGRVLLHRRQNVTGLKISMGLAFKGHSDIKGLQNIKCWKRVDSYGIWEDGSVSSSFYNMSHKSFWFFDLTTANVRGNYLVFFLWPNEENALNSS